MEFIDLFSSEGKFGDDIRIARIAVERIGLRGNIVAVFLPETVEIILYMETVHTLGRTVDMVIFTTVVAVNGEAVCKAVEQLGYEKLGRCAVKERKKGRVTKVSLLH